MAMGEYGAQPVYEVGNNNNDGFMGGNGIWVILIFLFLLGGNNGFGGFGGGAGGAVNTLTNEFLFTNLNQTIQRGFDVTQNTLNQGFTQLANQNFGIQKDLCQGFSGVQMGFANLQHSQDMCCCETNRNIDSIRYENAKNTCDIITAGNANTQRIVDTLTENKMQDLRDQLNAAQLTLGNASQTNTIINAIRPVPSPAYITCSPYTSPIGFNNGCNGCGVC